MTEIETTFMAAQPAVSLCSSFLGYFTHAGFVAGLEEGGVRPSHLAGASAGAFVAGLLAGGASHEQIREIVLSPRLKRNWWEWKSLLRSLPAILNLPGTTGVMSGQKVLRLLDSLLDGKRMEDCDTPVSVSVTNLTRGRVEWKSEGNLAQWIIASCAVPGFLTHQEIDGERYWDGGIADAYPCAGWLNEPDVRTVIIHSITHPTGWKNTWWNMSRSFNIAHETIANEIRSLHLQRMRAAGKQVVIVETETPRLSIFHDRKISEACWDLGFASGQKAAQQLRAVPAAGTNKTTCAPERRSE